MSARSVGDAPAAHARDFVDARVAVQALDARQRSPVAHDFHDPVMRITKRGELRQMRDADHLMPACERAQAFADAHRGAARPGPRRSRRTSSSRPRVGVAQHVAQREQQTRRARRPTPRRAAGPASRRDSPPARTTRARGPTGPTAARARPAASRRAARTRREASRARARARRAPPRPRARASGGGFAARLARARGCAGRARPRRAASSRFELGGALLAAGQPVELRARALAVREDVLERRAVARLQPAQRRRGDPRPARAGRGSASSRAA